MKRTIYPLYAPADEAKAQAILNALKARGVSLRDTTKPGKEDALLLFLSGNVKADGPEAERFFRCNEGRALIIPVNLDGCTPPEELQHALMARHTLDGTKYAAEELADRIARAAKGEQKSRLPLILSLAAAIILLVVGGVFYWRNRPEEEPPVVEATAEPTPTAAPTPSPTPKPTVDGIEVDLSLVAEVVYVGDIFQYYQMFDGYHMGGGDNEVRNYREVANDVWDGGVRFYSKETGQEIPMAPLGDVSYLKYLPNLMYLTFVNVQGELPDLSSLWNLRGITIINCDIPDLEGLRGSSIDCIEYHGATVTDFSPLNDCAKLTNALLAPWQFEAGAVLADLHPAQLNELSVAASVDDLSGLAQCAQLRRLNLRDTLLPDLACLQGLKLQELRMNNMDRLADLNGLQGMDSLRILEIEDCDRLTSFDGLQGMSRLESLTLAGSPELRDISALAGCGNLASVLLQSYSGGYAHLRDVSVLGKLPQLQSIGLYGVNVPDLDFLKELQIKKNINLGFCIKGYADYSGLAAIDSYSYLHVNTCGNYALAAPYLVGKTVRQLMIFDGGNVDLSVLPNVTRELDLCRCLNRDLTGIQPMSAVNQLWLQDCPYFTSFDGIENLPSMIKTGSILLVENCPRLADWSGIEGQAFHRIELDRVLTLPDFSTISFNELTLKRLGEDVLPDLGCLNGIKDTRKYSFRFEDLPQITDLSPLFRLEGDLLAVPPQVGEQAEGLVEDGRFRRCEIIYPNGGWDPDRIEVQLLSLDELETLPPSILKHVRSVTIVGDHLVNGETTDFFSDWSEWNEHDDWPRSIPTAVLRDRQSGEEVRITAPGARFTDFSQLSVLTGLEDLNLWFQPLTDLEGIQALENLQWLKVQFCPLLTDVSAAFTMQGLKELTLENCQVASLQGVQNLYDLETLGVSNTAIASLEGIEGLKHLCMVRLSGTYVRDFSPLAQVDFTYALERDGGPHLGLNVMDSGELPEDAFAFLEGLPRLSCLEVNDTPAEVWMKHVMTVPICALWASNCGITEEQFAAFVAAHPELEEIQVPWNDEITDMSILLGLERLRYVKVSNSMEAAVASLGAAFGFELQID